MSGVATIFLKNPPSAGFFMSVISRFWLVWFSDSQCHGGVIVEGSPHQEADTK